MYSRLQHDSLLNFFPWLSSYLLADSRLNPASCLPCLFQILEGVQDRAVPVVPPAQVYAAQTLYVLSLAFSQPATKATHTKKGRDFQLQPRRLLHQVRRDHRHLPRWRWVSPATSVRAATWVCHCVLAAVDVWSMFVWSQFTLFMSCFTFFRLYDQNSFPERF